MKKRWWLVAGAAVVVIAGGLTFWPRGGNPANSTPDLRTARVERGEISVVLNETGTVEPVRQVVVKPAVSGVVQRLHVREGDPVTAGAVLATVEPDLSQARAVAELRSARDRARVDLEQTRRDLEQGRALAASNLISEKELRDREAAAEQARLQLVAAEEQLRIVEQSGVSSQVRSLNVVAPAAGVVIRIGAEEGESVLAGTMTLGGGTELVTIADLSSLMIEATVNEVDIGKVAVDQNVTITVDAYPNDEWAGRISHIAPAARVETESRVRVFDVEVQVVNPDERLRPGMTANIDIRGERRADVLTIPVEAVFRKDGEDVIYKIENGQAILTPVTLGLVDLARAEVVNGAAEGDLVALEEPPDTAIAS
ncbi:MAG: efflux RND transporter periplasmic adaptor subunit [Gemmatimonadota bacterium]|nr:MAG: efflux RND transporter periplasmic adaptor subunit [Gemmatimonadota bacterium]